MKMNFIGTKKIFLTAAAFSSGVDSAYPAVAFRRNERRQRGGIYDYRPRYKNHKPWRAENRPGSKEFCALSRICGFSFYEIIESKKSASFFCCSFVSRLQRFKISICSCVSFSEKLLSSRKN